jgi:hypothetical protein
MLTHTEKYFLEKWKPVHDRGFWPFLLWRGLYYWLVFGFGMRLFFILIDHGFDGQAWSQELFSGTTLRHLIAFLLMSPLYAWIMWRMQERQYRKLLERQAEEQAGES